MKEAKLAIIAITLVITALIGCDEAAMLDDIITDDLVNQPTEQNEEIDASKREEILNFPEGATVEEKKSYFQLVKSVAVNTNTLDITGCNPNPLVLEVGYGEVVEIKNRDRVAHTLYHGGKTITIPGGGSRGVVATDFLGSAGDDGFPGYGCDDAQGGIFYVNSNRIVEPHEKQRYITFRVVEFMFPDGSSGPSLEGVTVTLEGSEEIKETATDGSVSFKRDLPLTVRLEKDGHATTEVTVELEDEEIILPSENKNINFRVVEPLLSDRNGPGIEGVTVTCLEGSDEGPKETAADGSVTFFGIPPLTIQLEGQGRTPKRAIIGSDGEIVLSNEWPEKVKEAIRQFGLTELIASGEIILGLGDHGYLETLGVGAGAWFNCPVILVSDAHVQNMGAIVHELAHAWMGLKSVGIPCSPTDEDWVKSKEGRAWILAIKNDLEEVGPLSDFDDKIYNPLADGLDKPLSELPRHSLAEFYPRWYFGSVKDLYQLAPYRCQYLENHFR